MADRYTPQIAGYYLNLKNTRGTQDYGISIKEYPYSGRNEIENLGPKTPVFRIPCVFMDNPPIIEGASSDIGILPTFEAHFNFLETLNSLAVSNEPYTFTHPMYGEKQGFVENVSHFHSDINNYVEINFDFVVHVTDDTPEFVEYIVPSQAKGWRDETEETTAKINTDLEEATSEISWKIGADNFMDSLDDFYKNVNEPATSVINTVTYATDYPGQVMHSINRSIDRLVEANVDIINSPAQFVNNLILGVRELKAIFTGTEAQWVHIMGSSRVSYEAGVAYDLDEKRREENLKKENVRAFDAKGNFSGEVVISDVLTANELDRSVSDVRELIDEVIEFDRDNRPLQDQAAGLQKYVNTIKINRERITEKQIPLQSMHTLAVTEGFSFRRADQLLKLNPDIQNPNFTQGNLQVLVS